MMWVVNRFRRMGHADSGIEKADCVVRRGWCGVNAQVSWGGGGVVEGVDWVVEEEEEENGR